MDLNKDIKTLGRVYKMYANRLEKLGIKTPMDFLFHIPSRYDDYSLISPIDKVQEGEMVTIQGEVLEIKNVYTRRFKNLQKAKVGDSTGQINILWFNQPYLTKSITVGEKISLSGKVSASKEGLMIISPDWEIITQDEPIHTGRLVPVYPETHGISSKWLRKQIKNFLDQTNNVEDFMPQEILDNQKLINLKQAILAIHFPKTLENASEARERLAFDELFMLQIRGKTKKNEWAEKIKGISLEIKKFQKDIDAFLKKLPFELTDSQKSSVEQILKDLSKEEPMNRLLQGDVGSGKTIVGAIAMYATFLNGYKSILMAPTEILAQQHFKSLSSILPKNIKIGLSTGSVKAKGDFDILVGTHAVLFKKINAEKLGLVIIDEQQRFGVKQRGIVREKGNNPHFLTMTATPIPRTVALTLYGDLDVSYLKDMPNGRKIIKTWLIKENKREDAYKWIEKEIRTNKTQAFIICPFIEESETMQTVKAATVEFQKLQKEVFKDLKLKLLHGKMKAKEKQEVMEDFKNKKFDILVATPLVEVGIDIPNATIIVIEAAERFGLAQLHQLRGRVGRNDMQSYCLLFTNAKGEKALQRLHGMEEIQNGADLAELDLKLRGAGDIYGTAQHGQMYLKVASFSDFSLIERATVQADKILPNLDKFPKIVEEMKKIDTRQISPD